jgi:hypothetical protein
MEGISSMMTKNPGGKALPGMNLARSRTSHMLLYVPAKREVACEIDPNIATQALMGVLYR